MHLERSLKKKNLTARDRAVVLSALLARSTRQRLEHRAIADVSAQLGIDRHTASRLWQRACVTFARTGVFEAKSNMRARGRTRNDRTAALERLRTTPPQQRDTIRAAASACDVAPMTLFRDIRAGRLRVVTENAKSILTSDNKRALLAFCLSHVGTRSMLFDEMENVVHIDEKMFFLKQAKSRVISLVDEPDAVVRLQSKRHIPRVMILTAVARPRYAPSINVVWSGKVGVWAFLDFVPARRSSRNRSAGTLVPNERQVTKTTYREMLVKNVLPALLESCPAEMRAGRIVLQQDNAPLHIPSDDPEFKTTVAASGLDVVLRFQPANSPDLNVLDLGLFTAMQARQRRKPARALDEHARAVSDAFDELPTCTLDSAFLTLQTVMNDCIAVGGDNTYKIKHMSKQRLEREGRLPCSIRCTATLSTSV